MSGCARSISARTRMAELLRVESLERRLRRGRVIQGSQLRARGRPVAGAARPQRRRQDDADQHADRRHHPFRRTHLARPARTSPRCRRIARARRGVGWTPQERNIFRSLTVEENLTAVALPGALDAEARLRALSRGSRNGAQHGPAIVGRRAADARDRPRAGAQPAPLAARRADRGPGADHRRRIAGGAARTRPRRACR